MRKIKMLLVVVGLALGPYVTPILPATIAASLSLTASRDASAFSGDQGGWTPKQVRGLAVWHRSDTGITQSGGKVSSWADLSASGFVALQGTGAKQPTYNTGGVGNCPGGCPFLGFDGANACLEWNATLGTGSTAIQSWMVVFRQGSTSSAFYTLTSLKAASADFQDIYTEFGQGGAQTVEWAVHYGSTTLYGFSPTLNTATVHVLTMTFGGGSPPGTYAATWDGATQTILAGNSAGRTASDLGSIGARITSAHVCSLFFSGDLYEVVAANAQWSVSEIQMLQWYALNRYNR